MWLDEARESFEEKVDPRVQVELERLNAATDEINRLEVDLDEAKNKFRCILSNGKGRIDESASNLGLSVSKARPYYQARLEAKQALRNVQKIAMKFEKATSAHAAAKEMVYLAEEGLRTEGTTFDHAWQEMLNHATMRVNESEAEKTESQTEHSNATQAHLMAEAKVSLLQRTLKKAISKSRPYYELKVQLNLSLEEQRQVIKDLEKQVSDIKNCYAETLRSLEKISDEIHQSRQSKLLSSGSSKEKDSNKVSCEAPSNRFDNKAFVIDGEKISEKATPGSSIPDTDIWSDTSEQAASIHEESENDSSMTGAPDSDSDTLSQLSHTPASTCDRKDFEAINREESGNFPKYPIKTDDMAIETFDGFGFCSFPVTQGCQDSQWSEIKLSSSGEEEFLKMRESNTAGENMFSDEDFDIPYAPLTETDNEINKNAKEIRTEKPVETSVQMDKSLANWILSCKKEEVKSAGEDMKPVVPLTPSKMQPIRRPSLDVLWNNTTGEKVKEMLSQSIFKLNIGSINERCSSETKLSRENTEVDASSTENNLGRLGFNFFTKKRNDDGSDECMATPSKKPNTLERRLSFLTAADDDQSDIESFASIDLLSDEQLSALLEQDISELYQDV